MKINIQTNFQEVRRQFASMARQVDFAAAVALTKTAMDARQELISKLPQIVDRPTRYTMGSVFVKKATRKNLQSEIGFKDNYQSGSFDESKHYMMGILKGGTRRTKRFEGRLIMVGKLSRGEHLVPTRFADFDQHGNVNPGQITKILSQLKTAVVLGDNSNASDSKRSQAKRSIEQYFWSGGPGTFRSYTKIQKNEKGKITGRKLVTVKEHLRRGVWMVRRTAFGNALKPIFYAVKKTKYKKVYDFPAMVQGIHSERFQFHFKTQFAQALATAR
jgi:hypothetical protein